MSSVLEPPQKSVPAQDRRSSRRLLAIGIRLLVFAAIGAGLGGGWYLAKKGFGRKTRHRIMEELHKHGIEAKIGHLTLDPFRGLVARDVRIYDYKSRQAGSGRENMLALISEISLDINYGALFHHQPFLNALDVRDAQLTLPLPGRKSETEKPELKNFRAHVYFPPEQIYLSQADGVFCGVHISATGQLIKLADYKPSPPLSEEEWQKRLSILQRMVTELKRCSFPAANPDLQIKFSGDVADMENARFEATLRADRVHRDQYEAREFFAAAEWAGQQLNVSRCEWKDATGTFSARGGWSRQSNDVNFQVRSEIDLKSLLEAAGAGKFLADVAFETPPLIELTGAGRLEENRPKLKIIGQARVAKLRYRSAPFTDLSANFSWDGEQTLLREVRLRQENGQLAAELFDAPNDFRLNIDSNINPEALRGFVSPEMQKFLAEWEWRDAPAVHLLIRGPDHDAKTWHGDGTLTLGRTRFRNGWMNNATAKVRFGDGAVTYETFRVVRDEGTGTGNFTYDFKNHEVRISNIKSSLHPMEIVTWIDPDLYKTIAPYKFHRAPNLTANGVYQFNKGKNTKLDINVDATGGMDYVFLGKTLPFDRVSAKLVFTTDRLQIVDLRGGLFSGSVRGGTDLSLAHNDPHYRANVALKDIDFPRMTELYYNYKTAQGRLNGSYDFTGLGSDARTMRGNGKMEVTNGDVFAIPIFGPLSGMLSSVLPGTGYSIARTATATFTIKDGILHTDDFDAAGKLFSMLGHGDIHFLDDKLAFEVRMDMHGGAGILLAPMYKLFEYTGEGSLKKPDWHPKRF
jgi:AsmA-like C-terminal region